MILYNIIVTYFIRKQTNKQTNTDDNIAIYENVTYLLRVYPLFQIAPILYYFLQTKYKQHAGLDKVDKYNYTIQSAVENY